MARGMGIDTPWVSLFDGGLALLNRIPIGKREVSIDGLRLYPDSVDRWLATWKWKLSWSRSVEARYLRTRVTPGMRVADVGANIGLHTLALARRVGRSGHVHAIEPEPRNFLALERAVIDAGFDQVTLHRAAAGAEPGEFVLHVSASNRGDHRATPGLGKRTTLSVERISLDIALGNDDRLDFAKLDVQGGEARVLAGMRELIANNREISILCELSPALLADNGVDFQGFFEPLEQAGLEPRRLDQEARPQPITPEDAWAQACREGYIDIVLQRP